MIKIHCSGCGLTEPAENAVRITSVTIKISDLLPTREWEKGEQYTEDLCDGCVQRILTSFFKVRANTSDPPIMYTGEMYAGSRTHHKDH